jgi:phosphoribosylformimino-5-aminoimidazole carboxamide ribotide isomerase
MFQVIPAIDIIGGQVVRLTQGDYGQVDRYTFSPSEIAKTFEDHGAKRLHIVDLDGAKKGEVVNLPTLQAIRKTVKCRIEFGGGIRSLDTAKRLIDAGVDYLVLGSLLVKQQALAESIIRHFPGKVIAGIDAKGQDVAVEGWIESSGMGLKTLIDHVNTLPLESIIYTDISKDGTLQGPNLEGLTQVAAWSKLPVIASGGVGTVAHIHSVRDLHALGVSGCIVGKAVLSGKIALSDVLG